MDHPVLGQVVVGKDYDWTVRVDLHTEGIFASQGRGAVDPDQSADRG